MREMTTDNSPSIAAQAAEVLWYHRLLINQKALEREDRARKKQIDDIITIINTLRQDHGRFVTRNELQLSVQAEVHRELQGFEDRSRRYTDERLVQLIRRLEPLEDEIKSLRGLAGQRQHSSDGLASLHDRVARVELQSRDNRQRLVETDLEVSRLQHQHFVEPLDSQRIEPLDHQRVKIPSINFFSSDSRLGQTRNGERYPSLDKRWEEFPADQNNILSPVSVRKIIPETQEALSTKAREALAILQPGSFIQQTSLPHEVSLSRQTIDQYNAKRQKTNHSRGDQLPQRADQNSRSSLIIQRPPLSERPLDFTQPAPADDVFGGGAEPTFARKAIPGNHGFEHTRRSRSNPKEAQRRSIPASQPRVPISNSSASQLVNTVGRSGASNAATTTYPMFPPSLHNRSAVGSMAPPATPLPISYQVANKAGVSPRVGDDRFRTPAGPQSAPWHDPDIRRSGIATGAGRLKRSGLASTQQNRPPTRHKQTNRRPGTVSKTPHRGSHIVMGMPVQGSQPRYMKQSETRPGSASTTAACGYNLRSMSQLRVPSRFADTYILEPTDPPPSRNYRVTRKQRQAPTVSLRQGTGLDFDIFEDNDPTTSAVQQHKPPHLQYGRTQRRAIPR